MNAYVEVLLRALDEFPCVLGETRLDLRVHLQAKLHQLFDLVLGSRATD